MLAPPSPPLLLLASAVAAAATTAALLPFLPPLLAPRRRCSCSRQLDSAYAHNTTSVEAHNPITKHEHMVMWDANVPVCCSRCAPVRAAAMRLPVAGAVSAPTADVRQVRRATVRTQRGAHHFSTSGLQHNKPTFWLQILNIKGQNGFTLFTTHLGLL